MGSTPRLKYQVPDVVPKVNKHTRLSSFAEASIKPLAVASHQRDCCCTTHYQLAPCALANSTLRIWASFFPECGTTFVFCVLCEVPFSAPAFFVATHGKRVN